MECTFESLPFLFPESHRGSLLAWRQAAVECERRLAARRQGQLQQLQHYITAHLQHSDKVSSWKRPAVRATPPPSHSPPLPPPPAQHSTLPTATSASKKSPDPPQQSQPPCPPQQFQPACPPQQFQPPCPPQQSQPPCHPQQSTDRGHDNQFVCRPPAAAPCTLEDVYAKVTALVRGYLTRRLLQSSKISGLINTIKDGRTVLAGITEPVSEQDRGLRDRVHTQLQLARMTLLEILALPVGERMAYIAHSRLVRQQRRQREERAGRHATGGGGGGGGGGGRGRLSMATQRAIQRRQKSSPALPATDTRSTRVTQDKPASAGVHHCQPDGQSSRGIGRTRQLHCPTGQQGKGTCPSSATVQDKVKSQKKQRKTVKTQVSRHTATTVPPPNRSGQTSSGQAQSGQARSGQAQSGQAQSGQARSGQARVGQVRSGQTTAGLPISFQKRHQMIPPPSGHRSKKY